MKMRVVFVEPMLTAALMLGAFVGTPACQVLDEARVQMRTSDRNASMPVGAENGGSPTPAPAGQEPGSAGHASPVGPPADPGNAGSAVAPVDPSTVTPPCNPPAAQDYCAHVPRLAADPVLDGELDCGARLLGMPAVGWNGIQPMPAQHRSLLAAGVHPRGLYVYVEVHGGEPARSHPAGSDIYCGDAVEIYVDSDGVIDDQGAYSSPGTMQFIIAAPAPTSPGTIEAIRFVGGENQGAWDSQQVRTRSLSDGYAVEAFITAADLELTAWEPSQRVGFDIAIDVGAPANAPSRECGVQLGQYFLRVGPDDEDDAGVCRGEPWCDSRAFCTPAL